MANVVRAAATSTATTTATKGGPITSLSRTALVAVLFYLLSYISMPTLHVVGNLPPQNHGDYSVLAHGFFVLCSAQGIASGGCVAAMTTIAPGTTVPLAKTANGQMLTSAGAIESAAIAGLLVLIDTRATFVATINASR